MTWIGVPAKGRRGAFAVVVTGLLLLLAVPAVLAHDPPDDNYKWTCLFGDGDNSDEGDWYRHHSNANARWAFASGYSAQVDADLSSGMSAWDQTVGHQFNFTESRRDDEGDGCFLENV